MTTAEYACAYCGRPAPKLDDDAILDWRGGELARSGEADPALLSLVCPDCQGEDGEEGAGD